MGRGTQIAVALLQYATGKADTAEALYQGLGDMFERGAGQPAQPDRFQREMAAYRAEVDAITNGGSEYDGMTPDQIAQAWGL